MTRQAPGGAGVEQVLSGPALTPLVAAFEAELGMPFPAQLVPPEHLLAQRALRLRDMGPVTGLGSPESEPHRPQASLVLVAPETPERAELNQLAYSVLHDGRVDPRAEYGPDAEVYAIAIVHVDFTHQLFYYRFDAHRDVRVQLYLPEEDDDADVDPFDDDAFRVRPLQVVDQQYLYVRALAMHLAIERHVVASGGHVTAVVTPRELRYSIDLGGRGSIEADGYPRDVFDEVAASLGLPLLYRA